MKKNKPRYTEFKKSLSPEGQFLATLILPHVVENLRRLNALMGESDETSPSRTSLSIMKQALISHNMPAEEGGGKLSRPLSDKELLGVLHQAQGDVEQLQQQEFKQRILERTPSKTQDPETGEPKGISPIKGRSF